MGEQPLDRPFGGRQQLEEAGEQPALVSVGADDERHRVRRPGAHRLDRVQRQILRAVGRADRERTEHVALTLDDQPFQRGDEVGRPGGHQRLRGVGFRQPQLRGEPAGILGGDPCIADHAACRAFRDRLGKRPLASGMARSVATACAPALSPKIVTLSGSPPKAAMFSRTQRSAITRSRRNRLSSMVTSARRQRGQFQATQRPEPVVHRDVDAAFACQRSTVVDRCRRTAEHVPAAVDEDHDGQRLAVPDPARRD